MADFAELYADQNEQEFSDFQAAAKNGTSAYTADIAAWAVVVS